MQITSGKVHYTRRKKTGDYEHAEMHCELSFNHDGDDADATLAHVSGMAMNHVLKLLGIPSEIVLPVRAAPKPALVVLPVPHVEEAAKPAPKPRGRPPGVGKVTLAPAVPAPAPLPPEATNPAEWVEEPEAIVETLAPAVITDAALQEHVTRKAGKVAPKHIRALMANYCPGDIVRIAEIPQDIRAEFLEELETLS